MKLRLRTGDKIIEVDFISEVAVPTPECYLLIYDYNLKHHIIRDRTETDIFTDKYAEFHVTAMHHIAHGYFLYDDIKIGAQVGYYVSKFGSSSFVPVLLINDFWTDYTFRDANSNIFLLETLPDYGYMLLDLGDFNRTRKALGLEEYTLKEYIARKLVSPMADDWGMTLAEETSLFSLVPDRYDANNILTVKGMRMFIEEQDRMKS